MIGIMVTISSGPGTTYVHSSRGSLAGEELCVAGACAGPDATLQWLTVLWIGAWMVLFVLAVSYLPKAQILCEQEQTRTRSERDAFERFARRIARLDAAQPVAARVPAGMDSVVGSKLSTTVGVASTRAGPDDASLREVRRAYQETVMSVPHYDDEYRESFSRNIAAEFDNDVATAVVGGSGLTPRLKRLLVGHADESRERRERFLEELRRESGELGEADELFEEWNAEVETLSRPAPSERSYGGLEATWRRLGSIADECERLLTARQRTIKRGVNPPGSDAPNLQEYLYYELPVKYPILASGADLLTQIHTTRSRTLDELATRT